MIPAVHFAWYQKHFIVNFDKAQQLQVEQRTAAVWMHWFYHINFVMKANNSKKKEVQQFVLVPFCPAFTIILYAQTAVEKLFRIWSMVPTCLAFHSNHRLCAVFAYQIKLLEDQNPPTPTSMRTLLWRLECLCQCIIALYG
jgi:hypothetical protein